MSFRERMSVVGLIVFLLVSSCDGSGAVRTQSAVARPVLRFHGPTDGAALSANGRYVVLALPDAPANELALVDLDQLTGRILVHPDRSVVLRHPSLSRIGHELLFVVEPPPYLGHGEVTLASVQGAVEARIEGPGRGYGYPIFSGAGDAVLFFANAPPPGGRPRRIQDWFLFHYGLDSQAETMASPSAFRWPCGLWDIPTRAEHVVCGSTPENYSIGAMPDGPSIFSLRGGGITENTAYTRWNGGLLKGVLDDGGLFIVERAQAADGRAVFSAHITDPSGADATRSFAIPPSFFFAGVSADGSIVVLGLLDSQLRNHALEVFRSGEPTVRVAVSQIRFERARIN